MEFDETNLLLYAVTDRKWLRGRTLEEQVEAALKGGATLIQLREKSLPYSEFLDEAVRLVRLCHRYNVPCLINDNIQIALEAGADGVHVGQDDATPAEVRQTVAMWYKDRAIDCDPMAFIIGVSAHNVHEALAAERNGATYLGCGALFGTNTKQGVTSLSLDELRRISQSVSIPVCAIGGITRKNIPQLAATGISGVALVSAIFTATDIEAECRALKKEICRSLGK